MRKARRRFDVGALAHWVIIDAFPRAFALLLILTRPNKRQLLPVMPRYLVVTRIGKISENEILLQVE